MILFKRLLYCAIGKVFLSEDNYVPAIEYMKKAIAKKDNVGCKQDLDRAGKLLAKQLEEQQLLHLLNLWPPAPGRHELGMTKLLIVVLNHHPPTT